MSTPWLSEDFKPSSRSRSRSPSENRKTRVDEFGRTVPMKPRGRSRSRSRSNERRRRSLEKGRERSIRDNRQGRRSPSREYGRREEKFVKRRRRRSSSGSSRSDDERVRPIASQKPKLENARLFVANLVSSQITKEDLMEHFKVYGKIIDVLVHPKNYAFVQYTKEEDAKSAVDGESRNTFHGRKLDVKLAIYGKRGGGPVRGGHTRGGRGRGSSRDRSASRDEFHGDFMSEGQPHRYPGEHGMRDPFYHPPGPYPAFDEPWFPRSDDPYRLDPYSDPYRDPYAARAPVAAPAPPAKIECQVFVVSPKLKAYGETIENRIKEHCIITAVTVMPEGETASHMLEDFADRDGLFAIFVNSQNEVHRSLTLNILHGTPQEHRNMPVNDAIALVGRSFEEYVDTLREKAKAVSTASSGVDSSARTTTAAATNQGFLAASSDVSYLLNLLADNQALTISELNEVIEYLKRRRTKMIDAERKNASVNDSTSAHLSEPSGSSNIANTDEIAKKILSIFSSAGGNLQGIIPNTTHSQQQEALAQYQHQPQGPAPPPPPPPPPPPAQPHTQVSKAPGNSVINFDNPNVQKALDQLIQSSPVLRQNFGVPSEETSVPSIESISQIVGRSSMIGYGHTQGPGRGEIQQTSHGWSREQEQQPAPGGSRSGPENY
ncbi:nuclear receptor coactivator 5 [Elysia marginata]|uniref:Nuclear receptor coactivator 5 n=1 Tax=Elysia marginata TaxID=1093978 RepID=A0AAV4I5V7_9GAST|nr:nuclear receptor coactivator 5 [Elysia marginata]